MSTGTVEETRLDESMMDASIRCQIQYVDGRGRAWELCDNEATTRVDFVCTCGGAAKKFVCDECLEDLKRGAILCSKCGSNTAYTWKSM